MSGDTTTGRVLVAGVGNIFLGDDGFGVAVAHQLAGDAARDGVRVADFGIRAVHLAYELLEGYTVLVLVDALPRGDAAGTLYVLEPDLGTAVEPGAAFADAHGMTPDAVLGLFATLGGRLDRTLVVGCEPADCSEGMELSEPVAAAVEPAAELVRDLLPELTPGMHDRRREDGDVLHAGPGGRGGRARGGGGDGLPVPGRDEALPDDPEDVGGVRAGGPFARPE